jgi:hypothetical protein
MKTKWFAVSALAVSLGATTGIVAARAYAAPASPGYASPAFAGYQEGRWDEPPSEFNDARRQGFHEGIEAARSDFEAHRHKDADDHEMYKHPPGDRMAREDFREGFRRGYQKAMDHMREEHHDHDDPHM